MNVVLEFVVSVTAIIWSFFLKEKTRCFEMKQRFLLECAIQGICSVGMVTAARRHTSKGIRKDCFICSF